MKKYILPFMSIAMLMAMASCSSSDDAVAENNVEGKLVQMTFTATQESNVSTRTALTSEKKVIWKSGDAISVFDYYGSRHNHEFTLEGAGGATSGSFTGTVDNIPGPYYAVYPYTEGAVLVAPDREDEEGLISGITLPSTQTAIKDSFDPEAALMIAASSNQNHLNFINVVSLVKVTTDFACKRIVLNANEWIAGTGMLLCNDVNPSITFTSNQSKSIVLKPATEGGDIEAGTYYIAVKPGTLSTGWSISFTSTDYNVYTRVANGKVTFNRGNMRSIGSFSTSGTWNSTSRGIKVNASQEVDLGLTITQADGKKYRVIFAKYNLTTNGLAEKESDYGDYFAWGATEPFYTSYNRDNEGKVTVSDGNWVNGGYTSSTCPSYDKSEYAENDVLKIQFDAARTKLNGDWQLPTKEIWQALKDATTVSWGNDLVSIDDSNIKGMKITKNDDTNTYLFLPAAGDVHEKSFGGVNAHLHYWSSSSLSNTQAYYLFFNGTTVYPQYSYNRDMGFPIRPVRLVEVDD